MNENDDIVYFTALDIVTKVIQTINNKVKCSLDSISELINDAELKEEFEVFKSAVNGILQNDLKECADIEGIRQKFT